MLITYFRNINLLSVPLVRCISLTFFITTIGQEEPIKKKKFKNPIQRKFENLMKIWKNIET